MEPVSEKSRLINRAYWLTKLRWIAILFVVFGAYFSVNFFEIKLHEHALYIIALILAVYNTAVLLFMNYLTRIENKKHFITIKNIINFQISTDLVLLTLLIHFSGGIENPFIFYFMFHMIISSILLSVKESYLQAALAVLLFGLMLLLEYKHILPHYCLDGDFVVRCLHRDFLFISGTYFAFSTAIFLSVYMTNYIAVRLRNAECAYRDANELLLKKDQIKNEYVLRVTHDIKGHLASIYSCLNIAKDTKLVGPLNEKQADFVGRAFVRTEKLSSFVRTLLTLTKMRLDDEVKMETFAFKGTIDDSISTVTARSQEKGVELKFNIAEDLGTVFGNKFSIEEAITNILLNAIKYTPKGGTVELVAKNKDNNMLVDISDTGMGIPQDEQVRVFEEFFRASNAKKVERDGTGLGLTIVKKIIKKHHGKIWVESKLGKGTSFKFTIPNSVKKNENK